MTETEIKPLPVGEAARGFAELAFASAKTLDPEALLRGIAKLQREGANVVERSLPIIAYQAGGGDINGLIKRARDLKADPEVGFVLSAIKTERLGDDTPESQKLQLAARLSDYQCAVIVQKLKGGANDKVSRDRQTVEHTLKRDLTDEERAAFGETLAEKPA